MLRYAKRGDQANLLGRPLIHRILSSHEYFCGFIDNDYKFVKSTTRVRNSFLTSQQLHRNNEEQMTSQNTEKLWKEELFYLSESEVVSLNITMR